MNMHMPATNTQ